MPDQLDDSPTDDLSSAGNPAASPSFSGRAELLANHPWIAYVLPLALFMAIGCFEPKPPAIDAQAAASSWELPYWTYPWVYTLKVIATSAALAWVWPAVAALPRRITPWSIIVGVVGVVLWVGLWKLQLEKRLLEPLGLGKLLDFGVRSAFNPLVELKDQPFAAYGFLAVRLFGLAVVVAMAEELFLRGFLMRYVIRHDWWTVPFGDVSRTAILIGTAVPMLMHPAELLAAGVWFSLVTWLMTKTRSLGDCIMAHATTNLLLGLYVLYSGEWTLL